MRPPMRRISNFYPRPPRGGRQGQRREGIGVEQFLPTPSARRATVYTDAFCHRNTISTHALREEGDGLFPAFFHRIADISTHALREEGDIWIHPHIIQRSISTHALREEGDL